MSRLLFDFVADKENNTLTVRREFAGERQLVWDCYTKQELLDQWFAPKPLTIKTKSMDFRAGGHWHYVMTDPDGNEFWGYGEYTNVQPIDYYESKDAFSDAEGNINEELPRSKWKVTFTDYNGGHTVVESVVKYDSLEELEMVINMGMEDGMMSTLANLDEFLANRAK